MATGYTHGVREGNVTTLRAFALCCARAVSANVMMKDDDMDAPIREYEPPSYYRAQLKEAREELQEVECMTIEQATQLSLEEYEKACEVLMAITKSREEDRKRYAAMLDKVQAWTPPTVEHEGFKKFMIEQLAESISHDCTVYAYPPPKLKSPAEYRDEKLAMVKRSVKNYEEEWEREQQEARKSNEWNRALFDSLKGR